MPNYQWKALIIACCLIMIAIGFLTPEVWFIVRHGVRRIYLFVTWREPIVGPWIETKFPIKEKNCSRLLLSSFEATIVTPNFSFIGVVGERYGGKQWTFILRTIKGEFLQMGIASDRMEATKLCKQVACRASWQYFRWWIGRD